MIDLTDPTPRGGYLKSKYKAWPHTRQMLDNMIALGFDASTIAKAEQAFLEEDRAHVGGQRLVREVRALYTRLDIARETP